jgi:hypothetical protein
MKTDITVVRTPALTGMRSTLPSRRIWGTTRRMPEPERTPDGRYIVVDGRRWRWEQPRT